ncbi:MMPL family transporter [Geodermatophilus normandii]|uniref:MMPL family transporter n=1 Tax=Geodermatophilus normandii TaxID=1137989 RepID=UPI001EF7F120|nr:MMPL family transporter [Geodermatophilus normandii]
MTPGHRAWPGARLLAATLHAVSGAARTAVVAGRWVVLAGWLVAAVAAVLLPSSGSGGGDDDIGGLLPPDSEAVAVQERSLGLFRVPVLSETSVVVHDPEGLDALTRADVALWALAHTQAQVEGTAPPSGRQVVAAVPLPTSASDTAVTYLYVTRGTSLSEATSLARQYASHFHNQASVQTYVTGLTPARVAQAEYLETRLHVFEAATLVLIAVVVALTFRSVVAPVVVLLVAGLAYVIALRVLTTAAAAFGFAVSDQLRPLTAALLIGVVTDYCVLFFSGYRRQLDRGLHRHEAAGRVVLTEGPIVAVAGVTVAAGTAALLVADFALFRAFGPALALTVLVGLLVSLTLVPALLAILGPRLFAPSRVAGGRSLEQSAGRGTRWLARALSGRRGAVVGLVLGVAVLVPAALPLADMRLGVSFTTGLPDDDAVQRGAQVLEDTGVRGVTAPTEIIVEGEGVAQAREALTRFQDALSAQPGVAEVLGPAQNPLPEEYGIVFSQDGNAARFVVVLDSDPLAAPAVADLRRLQERLDGLLTEAGLGGVTVGVTGQTALASELAVITRENLERTLLAVLLVELVILALFLRALLAPVVLLVLSALGVAAALGLTVLVFQGLLGEPGLTFFVPFATAVLLLALGSDYNVFAVGAIWDQAARRPLAQAIAVAMPATARAISAAGLILAATFAMVAIIPLSTFRQIAFTMAVGLLIDTFLIRPVLTPAVLTLLGRSAGWPGGRIRTTTGRPGAREQAGLLEEESDRWATGATPPAAVGAGGRT